MADPFDVFRNAPVELITRAGEESAGRFAQPKLQKTADPFDQFQDAPPSAREIAQKQIALDDIPAARPGYGEDIVKGAGSGLVSGAIGMASIPRLVEDVGKWTLNRIGNLAGIEGDAVPEGVRVPTPASLAGALLTGKAPVMMPGFQDIKGKVQETTGYKLYEPKTVPGEYAKTVSEFVPSMVMPGGAAGNLATRVGMNVLAPAVAAETAGQMTKGSTYEPYARLAGGIVGPAVPGLVGRLISPSRIPPERAQQAATLAQEGIPATAGQTTGNKQLRWSESVSADTPFAGGRAATVQEQQAERFTQAALTRAGINAPRATPEVIDDAFMRIGQDFNTVAARVAVPMQGPIGQQVVPDVRRTALQYNRVTEPSLRSGLPQAIADDLTELSLSGGQLTGEMYQTWRSQLGSAARGTQDPRTRTALYDIQNRLDDAAEQWVRAAGHNDVAETMLRARREYRNMLVIEKAVTSAGADAALGLISPSALRNATKVQNTRAYARGQGDFADLARAGAAIMERLPNSGTGPRIGIQMLGSAIGGTVGALAGGPEGAGVGALLPHMGMALYGRTVMNPMMQSYLLNQLPGQALGTALRDAPRATRYNALPGLIVQGND